jgi:hypothetical protein
MSSAAELVEELGRSWYKIAGAATSAYVLGGRLYLSSSGWLLLAVPNAFVHGLFDALQEPGVAKPYDKNDVINAHISVMTADEVEKINPDKITERGQVFRYQLGPIKTVAPTSWEGVSRVWYVTVTSPELRKLRTSYGLSPQPRGDWDFHITFGVRKKNVLYDNASSK